MCKFLFWLTLFLAAVWEISLHLLELRHLGKMQKGLFPFPGLPQAMPSFGNLDNSIAYARNRVKLSLGETLTNYILCVAIAAYGVPDQISQLIGNVCKFTGPDSRVIGPCIMLPILVMQFAVGMVEDVSALSANMALTSLRK